MINASFLGRLGRDPELKSTANGDSILSFSVATDHGYGEKKTTTWVRCSLFGKRADSLSQHLAKGSQVWIVGTMYTRQWEKKDGTTATDLECRVSELEFAGSKSDSQQQAAPRQQAAAPVQGGGGFDDPDIPFNSYMPRSIA